MLPDIELLLKAYDLKVEYIDDGDDDDETSDKVKTKTFRKPINNKKNKQITEEDKINNILFNILISQHKLQNKSGGSVVKRGGLVKGVETQIQNKK